MKRYILPSMMPNSNQFHSFIKEKTSSCNTQSAAYKVVHRLFANAEKMYRTLNFFTAENLSVFSESQKCLSPTQEHDLVALTALYVSDLLDSEIYQIIEQDSAVSDEEKAILKAAVGLFKDTAQAVHNALGNPRWIDE
jgi:hypothetical protein